MCVQRVDDSINSAIHTTFSHFAAFFIVARTKRSIVERCILFAAFASWSRWYPSPEGLVWKKKGLARPLKKGNSPKNVFNWKRWKHGLKRFVCWFVVEIDPSAGSPTETLLRLLLPLDSLVCKVSSAGSERTPKTSRVRLTHQLIQSVGATGGVYKGQGRIHCALMMRAY